jgi:hypothetical protein
MDVLLTFTGFHDPMQFRENLAEVPRTGPARLFETLAEGTISP